MNGTTTLALAIAGFNGRLAELIRQSGLPACVTVYLLKDACAVMEDSAAAQLRAERAAQAAAGAENETAPGAGKEGHDGGQHGD